MTRNPAPETSAQAAPLPALDVPVTRTRERLIGRSRFYALYDDDVRFMNGRPGRYFRLVQGNGVVVMPLAGDHTALVRTWRYAVESWEWGFPRGTAQGDDPEENARHEMTEEIGARPEELFPLGRVWPDSAHLTATAYAYAARFTPEAMTAVPADTEEIAEVRWLPVRDLAALIADGKIADGFTLSVFGLWTAVTAVTGTLG